MAQKSRARGGLGLIALLTAGALALSAISITDGPAKRVPYERKVKFQTIGVTHRPVLIEWRISERGEASNVDTPMWSHLDVAKVGDVISLSITQVTSDALTCMIIVDDEIINSKRIDKQGTCSVRALLPPA